MSLETKALKPLLDGQALAVDPAVHAWVAASAGTGKTQVLAARVLRLLLGGCGVLGLGRTGLLEAPREVHVAVLV